MNENTNNLITKHSFCENNVYSFYHCLKNSSWDFVYGSRCVQSAFTRFQGVIDQHFSTNLKKTHCHDKLRESTSMDDQCTMIKEKIHCILSQK